MWIKQRGNDIGYKLIVATYKIVGYKATKVIVWFVSLFYALVTPKEREVIKDYYQRVGVPYSFAYYLSHINQFALSIFDRFVTRIDPDIFEIEHTNIEAFAKKDKSRILALAHIGNWANTFVAFRYEDYTIHITTDEKLKASVAEYETSLDQSNSASIHTINLREGIGASIKIVNAIRAGDDVAIMVDRLVDPERFVEVEFLNSKTRFNKNPFEIAYNRDVDMVGIAVIRSGDKQYRLIFSNPIHADKSLKKEEAIIKMASEYGSYLEDILKEYPKQWFNFYKFWDFQ